MQYKVDKFELPHVGFSQISMPRGTKIVGVCRIKDRVFLQGLSPVETNSTSRTFVVIHQNDAIDVVESTVCTFIGSFISFSELNLPWLVFEISSNGLGQEGGSMEQYEALADANRAAVDMVEDRRKARKQRRFRNEN